MGLPTGKWAQWACPLRSGLSGQVGTHPTWRFHVSLRRFTWPPSGQVGKWAGVEPHHYLIRRNTFLSSTAGEIFF